MLLILKRGKIKSLYDLCGEVAARAALSVLFAAVRIEKKTAYRARYGIRTFRKRSYIM